MAKDKNGKTLNKNGKPRKLGSGRKFGSHYFCSTPVWYISEHFLEDDLIPISRTFLRSKNVIPYKPDPLARLHALEEQTENSEINRIRQEEDYSI
jgi:hypothetical protein